MRIVLNCCNNNYLPVESILSLASSSSAKLVGIVDSSLSADYTDILHQSSIHYWAWEVDLWSLIRSNTVCTELSALNSRVPQFPVLKEQFRAHAYRQALRQVYAANSHYQIETIVFYLFLKSIEFLSSSGADMVVSMHPPHHVGDYLLCCAGSALNIDTLIVEKDPYLSQTISGSIDWIFFREFQTGKYVAKNLPITRAYKPKVETFYYSQTRSEFIYTAKAQSSLSNEAMANKKYAIDHISDNDVISQLAYLADCKRHIHKNSVTLSASKDYILFCLHVEPEAVLSPMGYSYFDQLFFAASLSAWCSRLGLKIIVREHPCFTGLSSSSLEFNRHLMLAKHLQPRSVAFYAELLNLNGVEGFGNHYSFHDLLSMKNVLGVASIGGTTLLQSLQNGKIAVHGAPLWFENHPMCYQVNSRGANIVAPGLNQSDTESIPSIAEEFVNRAFPIEAGSSSLGSPHLYNGSQVIAWLEKF